MPTILGYNSKMKKNVLVLVLALLLSGCVNKSGARMGLFTAKSPVAVTIRGDIFLGWAVGDFTGSGTIDIQSVVNPSTTCVGEFRYISTWTKTGKGTVSCNDGSQGQFNFKGLTNLKGFGYGTSNRGPVTFTYGMTAEEAAQYLQKPFPELDKAIKERKKRDVNKNKNSA